MGGLSVSLLRDPGGGRDPFFNSSVRRSEVEVFWSSKLISRGRLEGNKVGPKSVLSVVMFESYSGFLLAKYLPFT